MRLTITNNKRAAYGIERPGGGFSWIEPGETRTLEVRNPSAIYEDPTLSVENADWRGGEIPASLAAVAQSMDAAPARRRRGRPPKKRQ